MTVISVTGHRPNRLGGYSEDIKQKIYLTALKSLQEIKPATVVTGMALGWDQAIAKACIELGIPFVAALPFEGQENIWPKASQEEYHRLLKLAFHVEVVNPPPYRPHKMFERNEWMINNSAKSLALWDGGHNGGTFDFIQYAMVCGKDVQNAWGIFNGEIDYLSLITKL